MANSEIQKADAVEKENRIQTALLAMLQGNRVDTIVRSLMAEHGIGQSTAYRYTHEATQRIHAKINGDIELRVNLHFNRLEYIYKEAMKETKGKPRDLKVALVAMKQMSDLLGLDAPKQHKLTGVVSPNEVAAVAVEDLDEGIEAYQAMKAMRDRVNAKRVVNTVEGEVVESTATNTTDEIKQPETPEDSTQKDGFIPDTPET